MKRRRRSWKSRGVGRIVADDVGWVYRYLKMYTHTQTSVGKRDATRIVMLVIIFVQIIYTHEGHFAETSESSRTRTHRNNNIARRYDRIIIIILYYGCATARAANLQFAITFSIHTHTII